MKRNIFVLILVLVVAFLFFVFTQGTENEKIITNFEECIMAGNPAMESYPRQCNDAKWGHFVEVLERLEESNILPKLYTKVIVQYEYKGRIVYTTDTNLPTESFISDCRLTRGGVFNSCGSPCAPDAEICVTMCAYTCELPQ